MLQTAIEAARRAGQLIAERYPTQRDVSRKGYRDLVTEAGGCCTSFDGKSFDVSGARCVATNGRIHEELLQALRGTS